MDFSQITWQDFKGSLNKEEGLVFLGTQGPGEWINGIFGLLKEVRIVPEELKHKDVFSRINTLTTTGGRTDLVFIFKKNAPIDLDKLAIWRLQFGDCSWLSDYMVNYKSQHPGESKSSW